MLEQVEQVEQRRPVRRRVIVSAVSLALAALLITLLPKIAGVTWSQLYERLASVGWLRMALLTGLWAVGLLAYTFVLTGSLPGLSKRRALLINCVGSGISNVLPFGGAAGVATTFVMTGAWGFKRQAVVVSTVVSGVWNLLTRFLLPAVGLACLLGSGRVPDQRLSAAAGTGGVLLIGVAAALSAALWRERAADLLGRGLDKALVLLPLKREPNMRKLLLDLRRSTIEVTGAHWLRMTLGMIAYMSLQGVLFIACLHATGGQIAIPEAVAAFAINRVLTTAVITPGGSGISESATALALLGFGVAPAAATAAVLLFWFFAHLIEIPVGWLSWTIWSHTARRE
ncbi:lysylphosphatidylglycerol synthase transmembrane domain-containing protein [Nonomuraea sp. NPDC005983]|uniref:lysylphosphatidylglycerol synthase transmembrane domain-containing protein n=1 Tax=Nonomuraea sp. NPDC005983 TaxID=3155595 RepID=UPI0033BCF778